MVFVMTLTSALLVLIMLVIWKTHIILIIGYVIIFGSVELLYLSSVLYKFDDGGYLPLAFAAMLMAVMYVWNYVYRKKYAYELENKVSQEKLREIADNLNFHRISGIALFYSELVQGIPPIFKHYVANVPSLHSVLVFVSIKSLPISKVPQDERFLFCRVEPRELAIFRCVVRYGYTDFQERESFVGVLVDRLKEFVREDVLISRAILNGGDVIGNATESGEATNEEEEIRRKEMVGREIGLIENEYNAGVVHLLGENEVVASQGSNVGKRILIDYAFNFLRRNLRQRDEVFDIPHKRLLKVGMTYEL